MQEYILFCERLQVGRMYLDPDRYLHLICNDPWMEFISTDANISMDSITDVLLDGSAPEFIRIPVNFFVIPENDKQRNLAISIYSKSGTIKSRMYVHDVDEKILVSYIMIDGCIIRTKRDLPKLEIDFDTKEETPEYTIGERLVYFRKRARLSGVELAKMAGITPTTICSIENGRIVNPGYLTCKMICEALEISMSEFFSNDLEMDLTVNETLLEEIKMLTSADQAILAKRLRENRLHSR